MGNMISREVPGGRVSGSVSGNTNTGDVDSSGGDTIASYMPPVEAIALLAGYLAELNPKVTEF